MKLDFILEHINPGVYFARKSDNLSICLDDDGEFVFDYYGDKKDNEVILNKEDILADDWELVVVPKEEDNPMANISLELNKLTDLVLKLQTDIIFMNRDIKELKDSRIFYGTTTFFEPNKVTIT